MRVGIVGGGLAGLAAGHALSQAGVNVELFERSRLLGGRATSFEIDGVEVDNGQHVFLGCCTAFQAFVDDIGFGDSLYVQERFDALVVERGGIASRLRAAPLPAPWHLIASFLRFRLLSLRSKIDVARALAAASGATAERDESFAGWLARHRQGAEAVRVFWTPFFVPALNLPLERMDAREALFTLRTAFLGDAAAARFGFSTVPLAHIAQAAAERIGRVHRSSSVASLELDEDARRVRALVTTKGERVAFDAFVLALTPPQLLALLGDTAPYGLPSLDAFTPAPIVDVHLRYNGAPASFDFAALVGSPVQWVFRKAPGYLVCSMSAADAYLRRTTDELVALAWEEVRASLGLDAALLERGAVTRSPEATFSAPPGMAHPGPATGIENVALAGSWTGTGWPDTMESAVRSGLAAARRIISS